MCVCFAASRISLYCVDTYLPVVDILYSMYSKKYGMYADKKIKGGVLELYGRCVVRKCCRPRRCCYKLAIIPPRDRK